MIYAFAGCVLDAERRELTRDGEPVALEPQVFDLLVHLVRHRDRVVSKDDLIEAIWGGRIISESAVTTRLNAARKAIGDNGSEQRLIRTLPRKGIRFVGAVREPVKAAETTAVDVAAVPAEPIASVRVTPGVAERRQLTVASCELLISVAGGGGPLDPEDLHDVMGAWQRWVASTAAACNGFVGPFVGGAVLIYFGYPVAREDDVEQAVRAGLKVIDAGQQLTIRQGIVVRASVGIATGVVVVGELAGMGAPGERGVVGDTPNLAVGLQTYAEPGQVVIAPSTRQLAGDLFEYADLGPLTVKGATEPVHVWRVVGESAVRSRSEARHHGSLTPLVGRDEELELFLRRWRLAVAGSGRALLVSGEPGIGKSRLLGALQTAIEEHPHITVRYFCSPHRQDSPLWPVISQLERMAGFERTDPLCVRRRKLTSAICRTSSMDDDVSLLAELLDIAADGGVAQSQLTSRQRREKTYEALLRQIECLSNEQPLLMIVEDVHWLDPSSLELLEMVIDRIPRLRVLLVVTFRPDFQASWGSLPHVTTFILNRLGDEASRELIDRIAATVALPEPVIAEIVDRTDGIPLFIEEVTRSIVEAIDLAGNTTQTPKPTSESISVPPSLRASLMARLDRLGPAAKEVAQIGAIIGREFSYELLSSAGQVDDQHSRDTLHLLQEAGLISRRAGASDGHLLFKHALVRDVIYESCLRSQRVVLHSRIAAALMVQADSGETHAYEAAAIHFLAADEPARALPCIVASAIGFGKRYAYVEALHWFDRGAEIIRQLPNDNATRRLEFELYVAWLPVLMAARGFTDSLTLAVAEHADVLCQEFGRFDLMIPALFGKLSYFSGCGKLHQSLEVATRICRHGTEQDDPVAALVGRRAQGFCYHWLGRFAEARSVLDAALEYEHAVPNSLAMQFGFDPVVTAVALLGSVEQSTGNIDGGKELMNVAVERARSLGHPLTLAYVLRHFSVFAALLPDLRLVQALAAELTVVCRKYEIRQWEFVGPLMQTWVTCVEAPHRAGDVVALMELLTKHEAGAFKLNLVFYRMLVGEVLISRRDPRSARAMMDGAMEAGRESAEAWIEPYLSRVAAML